MKELRILTSALEIRNANFPVSNEFNAVKLTYAKAMNFANEACSFSELVAKYGKNNVLHVGEFYEGYLAVYHWPGHVEVVRMNGLIRKIAPTVANGILNYRLAENIREGKAWECVYPTSDGSYVPGAFQYVWTFRDCSFANNIKLIQSGINDVKKRDAYSHEMISCYEHLCPEQMDADLKTKLVAALLTNDKIVALSLNEDMVLQHYLGESYYKKFFVEVK